MKNIGVIDCGLGNALAVQNILEEVGAHVTALKSPQEFDSTFYDWIIAPGVGNFGEYADRMQNLGWQKLLSTTSCNVLGICVGFQYLALSSFEAPGKRGLGVIETVVQPLESLKSQRVVPNVGWYYVSPLKGRFYFTHSYYVPPSMNLDNCVGLDLVDTEITVYVKKDNYYGVQFHPEKSGQFGLSFFKDLING